ncbi:MAG: hypothetical protein HQL24_08745 [Candidatus Omnitrophica bacterium]|nr:hypothetical protein [Candidatus Omnitrophota bacterium]
MAKKMSIPNETKQVIEGRINRFNKQHRCQYIPRYKNDCLYLDRQDGEALSCICRLTYNGKLDDWDFAIFKYSSEQYDDEEFFFPGADFVDGTVEGAMMAGLEAYPW